MNLVIPSKWLALQAAARLQLAGGFSVRLLSLATEDDRGRQSTAAWVHGSQQHHAVGVGTGSSPEGVCSLTTQPSWHGGQSACSSRDRKCKHSSLPRRYSDNTEH